MAYIGNPPAPQNITSAEITDGTIINGDIASDAAIAATKIAGLATVATTGAYADVTGTPTLATVATTGAYADVTGTPNLNTFVTQSDIDTSVAALVDSSPTTLNTLNELAAALGDDPNFATTVTNSIATKMPLAGGTFTGGVSGTTASFGTITATSSMQLGDNVKAQFGASNDLQIYHDGSNSVIKDAGTGNLQINAGSFVVNNAANSANIIVGNDGGAVTAFHNGAAKLATKSNGVNITGEMASDSISLNDNAKANFGNSSDLQIYHDGLNSYIKDNGTGDLYLQGTANVRITNTSGQKMFLGQDGGEVQLYYNGSEKLNTTSTGINVTGTAVTDGLTVDGTLDIEEVLEHVETSASTTSTITIEATDGAVWYFTANQTANRTINFRGNSGLSLNSLMNNNQSMTFSVAMTQGSTAYYLNAYQVDGSTVTPKWSGGEAPTEGNASGIDVYTFTIIKTANATFTVLASQTQFA